MSVWIITSEEAVQASLKQFINELGSREVLVFDQPAQAISRLERGSDSVDLIVATWTPEMPAFRRALEQHQQKDLHLNFTALIIVLPFRPTFSISKPGLRNTTAHFDRVDYYLPRPFNRALFSKALQSAYERRARARDVALLVGDSSHLTRFQMSWTQCLSDRFHWKNLLVARDFREFQECVAQQGLRIGAVIVDPQASDPRLVDSLLSYRKTVLGRQTPYFVLSQNAESIGRLRTIGECYIGCELVLDIKRMQKVLESVLETASRRVLKRWMTLELLNRSKETLKSAYQHVEAKPSFWSRLFKKSDVAERLLIKALKLDPRSEVYEALGRLYLQKSQRELAISCFRKALETNPYSPRCYLSLLELFEGDEANTFEILQGVQRYCPNVPQLKEKIERRGQAA